MLDCNKISHSRRDLFLKKGDNLNKIYSMETKVYYALEFYILLCTIYVNILPYFLDDMQKACQTNGHMTPTADKINALYRIL